MEHAPWFNDVCVFLAVAGLIVPLFRRAGISASLGFIIAGVVIGPFGFGRLADDYPFVRYLTIEDRERVEPFGELGVMFLLFMIGLELSLPRLWSMRRYVLGIGGAQVSASALSIGLLVWLLGAPADAAVVLGLALAMSSTALVMQILREQGRTATVPGHIAFAVLLFQDVMVAPALLITGMLSHSDQDLASALATALLGACGVLAFIAIAGRYLLRPLLRFAGHTGSRDLIMAITVLIVLTVSAAMGAAGLSAALGAFLAGLLLGETEYRQQIEVDLEPFNGLLLGLFFIGVGMAIDVTAIWPQVHWLALAVAALLCVKAAILFVAARAFGTGISASAELALLLPQAGEFAFVVIGLAAAGAILSPTLASFALGTVSLSMMATPALAWAARRLGQGLHHIDQADDLPDATIQELKGHVVIGGYDHVGQTLARVLETESIPFVALDTNAATVTRERATGRLVFLGDAGRPEMLARAGIARASAVVVTLSSPHEAERMVANARRQNPDAVVIARARDGGHAARLLELGAVGVIPEATEAGLQLGGRVLDALAFPDHVVARRLAQAREAELGRLPQGGKV